MESQPIEITQLFFSQALRGGLAALECPASNAITLNEIERITI